VSLLGDQTGLLRRYVWRYFDGLTDDELHWEPVPDMWGMRLRSELRVPWPDHIPGDHGFEVVYPEPAVPPLTTIAWRIGHLISVTMDETDKIGGRPDRPLPALPYDASSLLVHWRSVLDDLVHVVRGLPDERFAETLPQIGPEVTVAGWLGHLTFEIAFHSAEVGTMRHLFREMHGDR
jgi:hypothetical protein